ncbi:MAG: CHAT domain-containing protein, partial [Vicinamibacterales bacterium]
QDSRVQPAVMKRALHELNELLQRDRVTGRSLTDLRAIGGLLGEDIFQALGRTLDDERLAVREETPGATPHLQLQIPVELMGYPWELLHRRGVWLGEQFALGRQVFMPTGLARRVPARRQGCVRPLVIGDPIFDPDVEYRQLAGARREAEQVAGWFERASAEVGSIIDFDRERDTRIGTRITSAELRALLRDGRPGEDGHYYDIVHFAGHGIFREEDRETSAWLLSDGELWALEIRNTLQDHPAPPWLVYANACEAGMDGGRPARVFQGNVFGLATAFINQGVAAYVGPLWPIDDLLAQHIALQFYQQLLAERSTLGEALRRAKISARAVAYAGATGQADAAWPGLGWASLVMYGDPTEELFQALAGGSRPSTPIALGSRAARPASAIPGHADEAFGAGQPSVSINTPAVASLLHAPDHVVAAWVRGPGWIPAAPDTRGAEPEGLTLELIEDAGLRRWRVKRPGSGARGAQRTSDHLPGSSVAALLEDDRIREQLPSTRSIPRIIGSWVLSGLAGGARGLVRRYDEEQVRQEGLLFAAGVTGRELMTAEHQGPLAPKEGSQGQRVLLIMHGTFSNSAYLTDGLGPGFMAWARQRYGAVMALDHWTLSKTPEQNAALLADELRAFDAGLLDGRRIDIIAHSRGGLVARAFCELLGHAAAVRTLIFIGTPNCGTDLATPRHWGTFADLLVNMTGVDGAEFFGRAAGLLAQLAVAGLVNDVPGLLAQSPESLSQPGSFLNRLQDPGRDRGGVRYSVICSEFEPNVLIPNLRRLSKAAAAAGLDAAADALFATANDLVVNTAYAWGIGTGPSGLDILPPSVGDRVLLFMPPTTALTAPPGAAVEIGLNVHHCNVFNQPRALLAIQSWLDG